MTSLQIESTERMINKHGLEEVINFYLDCMLESDRYHQHWFNALIYCSYKINLTNNKTK